MKLSDEIKFSLGIFSPNPDNWTLMQRLGLEWGRKAYLLEAEVERLRERYDHLIREMAKMNNLSDYYASYASFADSLNDDVRAEIEAATAKDV